MIMDNRRTFLRTLGRGLLAAGLAGMGGYLLLREPTAEACSIDFICGSCGKRKSCTLPEAENFRKATPDHQSKK